MFIVDCYVYLVDLYGQVLIFYMNNFKWTQSSEEKNNNWHDVYSNEEGVFASQYIKCTAMRKVYMLRNAENNFVIDVYNLYQNDSEVLSHSLELKKNFLGSTWMIELLNRSIFPKKIYF